MHEDSVRTPLLTHQVTVDIFKRSTPSVVNVTNLTARCVVAKGGGAAVVCIMSLSTCAQLNCTVLPACLTACVFAGPLGCLCARVCVCLVFWVGTNAATSSVAVPFSALIDSPSVCLTDPKAFLADWSTLI
jgi:hypothetical protein